MNFYTNLYVGEEVRHPQSVKWKLRCGLKVKNISLITMAPGNDLLEIYDSGHFCREYYKKFPRMIVGMATGYDEAVSLVIQIIEETLHNRGDCNVRAYFEENKK